MAKKIKSEFEKFENLLKKLLKVKPNEPKKPKPNPKKPKPN